MIEGFTEQFRKEVWHLFEKGQAGSRFKQEFSIKGFNYWLFVRSIVLLSLEYGVPELRKRRMAWLYRTCVPLFLLLSEGHKMHSLKGRNPALPPKENKRLIITSYSNYIRSGSDVYRVSRVYSTILAEGRLDVQLLIQSPLNRRLDRRDRMFCNVYNFLTRDILMESYRDAKAMRAAWKRSRELYLSGTTAARAAYEIDFALSPEMLFLAGTLFRCYRSAFSAMGADAVFSSDDVSLHDQCITMACEAGAIWRYVVEHGVESGIFRKRWQPKDVGLSHKVYLTASKERKKEVMSRGIANAVVTGPIILDSLYAYKSRKKKSPEKTVLFLTSSAIEHGVMGREEYFSIVRNLLLGIKASGAGRILIKNHPREVHQDEYLRIIREECLANTSLFKESSAESLYEAIIESDAVFHLGSTAGIEAMLLGKPSVLLLGGILPWDTDLLRKTYPGILIEKPEELEQALRLALTDRGYLSKTIAKQNRMLAGKVGKIDGKSIGRWKKDLYARLGITGQPRVRLKKGG